MQRLINFSVALLIGSAFSHPASAEIIEKTGTFGGLKTTYKVVLPSSYDPSRAYPGVLVFTGGPQTLQIATSTLEADWRLEAERRGYIVVSPGSPDGSLFFEGADRVFPEFLDRFLRDYKLKGKLTIAGHSNGGLSAFHIAARYPEYFSVLIGYPGLLDDPDLARMPALKPLCIFMHVGERDDGWKPAMQRQADDLRKKGFNLRSIIVEPNQVHRLKAQEINLSSRLFDEIESCNR